eukprot:SAG31_NODE_38250_length_297_cov_1.924242_1_plen_52_part_00
MHHGGTGGGYLFYELLHGEDVGMRTVSDRVYVNILFVLILSRRGMDLRDSI